MRVAGLIALWRFPMWEQTLTQLLMLCDKVFVRFDERDGDMSIPPKAISLMGDQYGAFFISDDKWTKAGWREDLLRSIDDYKPDLVLFPDEDEMYGDGITDDLAGFYSSDKAYMMFEYETPLPTDDGRIVNNGKPYPGLPHMKAFKWKLGLTYHPYPTLARLASYGKDDAYSASTKMLHYCFYTKEEEDRHIFNKMKERG